MLIYPSYLLLLFLAHWVGDFLLQSNAMASQKSKSIKWLTVHVAVYTATLGLFSILVIDSQVLGGFILVNAGLHWITDFFTSKLAYRYRERPKTFYAILGLDQLIHYSCLAITFQYFTLGFDTLFID
jgi:hypothetical protein